SGAPGGRPGRAAAAGAPPTPSAHPMFAQPPVRAAAVDAAQESADAGPVHPAPGPTGPQPAGRVAVLAKPPVRRYAREAGVDLATVTPTGPHGTITREDVELAAQARPAGGRRGVAAVAEPGYRGTPAAGPAFDPATRERRIPVKGVRKHTAAAMVASAFTAPHVTEFVTVDVTRTMELRDRVAALPDYADLKVSPLLFVARALLVAVRRHPMMN